MESTEILIDYTTRKLSKIAFRIGHFMTHSVLLLSSVIKKYDK